MSTRVPVLDLRPILDHEASALAALRAAAHEVGFLALVGSPLDRDRIAAVLAAAAELLALPHEAKQAAASVRSPAFRGWSGTGAELTRGRPDRREQIDFGRDEPALAQVPDDAPGLRLRGPNQWPTHPDAAARIAVVDRWWHDAELVGRQLLAGLVEALGLPAKALDPIVLRDGAPDGHLHGKLLRYPVLPADAPAAMGQGVGPHKDYGLLALLVQDGVGGLQAQLPGGSGDWVDIAPRDDAVVVNLGEVLELLTGGYLIATPHRVLSPTNRERHSVAVFLGPRLDVTVHPLALPAPFGAGARGVTRDPDNPLFADYGTNSLKGWLRAHPETARRHHADLVDAATADSSTAPARTDSTAPNRTAPTPERTAP